MEKEINPQQAAEILERERNERAMKCAEEIANALKKHNCEISYQIMLTSDGKILPRMTIKAN